MTQLKFKWFFKLFLSLSVFSGPLASALASKPDMHKHMASCFRIVNGQITDIELDLYQAFQADLTTPTGYGFATEKLLNADGSRTKVVFPLEITDKQDEISVIAYLHNDSSKVIAKFAMPKKPEFNLKFRIFGLLKREFVCTSDQF